DEGTVRAGVAQTDSDAEVLGVGLGVVDRYVPVTVVSEDAGVEELVLPVFAAASRILGDQVLVRESVLWVDVPPAQPGRGGSRVAVPPVLLGVLAVVALGAGEAEDPLLQQGVDAIPQGQREAESLALVADAGEAILAPAIGTGARMIVRDVLPRGALRAVILPHRAPLALREVGTPEAPACASISFRETRAFGVLGRRRGTSHPVILGSCRTAGPLETSAPLDRLLDPGCSGDSGRDQPLACDHAETRAQRPARARRETFYGKEGRSGGPDCNQWHPSSAPDGDRRR